MSTCHGCKQRIQGVAKVCAKCGNSVHNFVLKPLGCPVTNDEGRYSCGNASCISQGTEACQESAGWRQGEFLRFPALQEVASRPVVRPCSCGSCEQCVGKPLLQYIQHSETLLRQLRCVTGCCVARNFTCCTHRHLAIPNLGLIGKFVS